MIALALARNGTVVSEETLSGDISKPRISDVCKALNVPVLRATSKRRVGRSRTAGPMTSSEALHAVPPVFLQCSYTCRYGPDRAIPDGREKASDLVRADGAVPAGRVGAVLHTSGRGFETLCAHPERKCRSEGFALLLLCCVNDDSAPSCSNCAAAIRTP
ncbi:DUF4411 family protein [Nocardia sp. NBC_01388]